MKPKHGCLVTDWTWRGREKLQAWVIPQRLAQETMAWDHSLRERPAGEANGVGLGREGPVWAVGTQWRCPRAASVMDLAFGRRQAGERSPVGDAGGGHCWGELRAGPDPGQARTEEPAGEKGRTGREQGD